MVRKVKAKIKKKVFPMKFPLNPFAGTLESLEKVINRLLPDSRSNQLKNSTKSTRRFQMT